VRLSKEFELRAAYVRLFFCFNTLEQENDDIKWWNNYEQYCRGLLFLAKNKLIKTTLFVYLICEYCRFMVRPIDNQFLSLTFKACAITRSVSFRLFRFHVE
jgi:hypothetical protein